MKRIEAPTLEEAYKNAAKELGCSVTEINYEIVQYPTTGMMGLFKKSAIIIAVRKLSAQNSSSVVKEDVAKSIEEKKSVVKESKHEIKEELEEKRTPAPIKKEAKKRYSKKVNVISDDITNKLLEKEDNNTVLDSFFDKKDENRAVEDSKTKEKITLFNDDRDTPENRALSTQIEDKLTTLMRSGCFDIDTVEVDVFNNTAHIFIDGEDAALLIGKEGYRYNALSYMLFNWINTKHNLYIKLEIAEFIQAQEEMIVNYLKPIIEHINENGRGKTKPLDGILVQIALELLRAEFPNKYVAIKTAKDNRKFIIINNFNSKKNV